MPVAAIGAVLVVLLFELFIQTNRSRFEDGIEANLHAKRDIMRSGTVRDDVAIFGDSKFFSVRPDVVSTAIGAHTQASNYSWPFMGIEAYDAMLRTYLLYKPAPKLILVNARPEMTGMPERCNAMDAAPAHRVRAYEALPLRTLWETIVLDKSWYLLWDRIAYALQPPSAQHKKTVWPAVKRLIRGRGWPLPTEDYVRMTSDFNATGAFLMHRKREVPKAEVLDLEKLLGPYGVYENKRQVAAFERFLTRAEDAGTTVLMLGVPMAPPLHQRFEAVGANAGYLRLTNSWQQRFANFRVLEPLLYTYPLDHFGDPGHVNFKGDAQFQKDYASALKSFSGMLSGK